MERFDLSPDHPIIRPEFTAATQGVFIRQLGQLTTEVATLFEGSPDPLVINNNLTGHYRLAVRPEIPATAAGNQMALRQVGDFVGAKLADRIMDPRHHGSYGNVSVTVSRPSEVPGLWPVYADSIDERAASHLHFEATLVSTRPQADPTIVSGDAALGLMSSVSSKAAESYPIQVGVVFPRQNPRPRQGRSRR